MSVIDRFKDKEEVRLKPDDTVDVHEEDEPEDVTHFFNENESGTENAVDLPGAGNTTRKKNGSPAAQLGDKLDTLIDQNQRIIALLEQYTDNTTASTTTRNSSTTSSTDEETETLW